MPPFDAPYIATKSSKKGWGDNIPITPNLAAWYRYRRGITNTSGGVSSWADASGRQRPLLQATSAIRPTMMSDGTLLFDGVGDYMQAAFTLIQPFTVFMLFQQVTWTSGDVIFDGATGTTKVTQTASTPELTLDGGSALSASNTIPVGKFGVMACVFNGATSRLRAAGGGPTVSVTGNAGSNNPGGITIGATRTPGNYSNIMVREIAIYSVAQDATTRLQILRYLGRLGASVGGIA